MTQVITANGFAEDRWRGVAAPTLDEHDGGPALTLRADDDPAQAAALFDSLALIVIPFGSSADGRGFSLAGTLRALGFRGRIRARGHVLVDQFRAALRAGIDEVEISPEQARRNPEAQWRAVRPIASYQSRIFAS